MMKKTNKLLLLLLLLAALALALPALAFPPQCDCAGYCTLHGGTATCTIVSSSGNTVVTCGYFYGHYCEGPA
jgi:hypothetical protein